MTHHYVTFGEGIPFIFQHGLGASVAQVEELFRPLTGAQLISLDMPGHGTSSLPKKQQPSFNYYADKLVELMDELHITKAIFGGISMGAGIALDVAQRYPDRLMGLVLVRPAWLTQSHPLNLRVLLDVASALESSSKGTFVESEVFQQMQSNVPAAADSLLGLFSSEQRMELPYVLREMVGDKPIANKKNITSISSPCLIIGNDHDPLHPYMMAEKLHEWIAASQLVKVPSRYKNNVAHTEEVNQVVSTFIGNYEEYLG